MKKIFAIAAACVALAACNKEQNAPDITPSNEMGTLSVDLLFEGALTKAPTAANSDLKDYEKNVNSIQIFVFGDDGKIQSYRNLSGDELTNKKATISVIKGNKEVWAVVNGKDLKGIKNVTSLQTSAVALEDNSTTASKGFVMAGSGSCNVTAGATATPCQVTVSRLVSRVVLAKIENQCPSGYGDIKIKSVFLTNVVGNQQLNGEATPTVWYNPYGRNNSTSKNDLLGKNNFKGECPELTFKTVNNVSIANGQAVTSSDPVPCYFYSFANDSDVKSVPGEDSSWTPVIGAGGAQSKLVILAEVNGTEYYYPVNLKDKLARNTSYTVGVTITGPGSVDPDMPVEKGNIDVSIDVQDWAISSIYDETI